ncbi:MerR family transcriptional regulator [Streptomyces tropicalis]|uniref:MerR family transcriptional regulator n=1 Tax=Streptomyces tropicalis TaxID=3034234 RepID=A0ABT6A9K1_9ACTN|nr:MerR family transcriptional regulator [Streptomyces tropicalis]MDF3301321.1 MerR family transcriptional regulator [Streptomyces tropicalis]
MQQTAADRPARADKPPPAGEAGLTTGALARRLGVSPTTLRSWDRRYGIGPAVRADGRHRRWTPRDVETLEAMCRLTASGVPPAEAARAAQRTAAPAAPETAPAVPVAPRPVAAARSRAAGTLPLGDVRQECRGLARAAVRLDAPAVEQQLGAAVEEYGVAVAWQEVMVPTLHAVGRKWASSGDRYVEVEHLLSWHVSTTLRRFTPPPAPAGDAAADGPVLLACAPGEQHSLPLEALNAALGERGVPTRMLGAAVPAEALAAAVQRLGPPAVVLWAQARSTASLPLARYVAGTEWGVRGARRHPLVVLGGPGWTGRPVAGLLRPGTLADALDALSAARASASGGAR